MRRDAGIGSGTAGAKVAAGPETAICLMKWSLAKRSTSCGKRANFPVKQAID